jgi:hydrogenase/urease accessory protein HupE
VKRILFLLVLAAGAFAPASQAHEVRPAYLELRQTDADTYDLLFKVPALGAEYRLGLYLLLPEDTQDVLPPQTVFAGGAHVERRTVRRPGGLIGQRIAIDGLPATFTDVLVRIESIDGTSRTERLTPTRTSFTVTAAPGGGEVAATYFMLGVEHILFGFDHLLFVLALVILVRTWRRVVLTVTAFTVAHSITLAAATLGFVHMPGPPVEAAIALSIVLVAAEIVSARRGRSSLTLRWPWLLAFVFGLLHGLGFAGALSEVGLPQHAIPVALLFFNLGVEAGQLAFVACVTAIAWAARFVFGRLQRRPVQLGLLHADVAVAYAIGVVASFWVVERVTSF